MARNLSDDARRRMSEAGLILGHTQKPKGSPELRTWNTWCKMRQRCRNVNCKEYPRYGGRGIQVDPAWEDYMQFVSDMGLVPEGLELDRVDNNGNYCHENCRWATPKQQARNRRSNRILEIDGQSKTLAEWAEVTGIESSTIRMRIKYNGGRVDSSILAPVKR
jgi:hypothetical protein